MQNIFSKYYAFMPNNVKECHKSTFNDFVVLHKYSLSGSDTDYMCFKDLIIQLIVYVNALSIVLLLFILNSYMLTLIYMMQIKQSILKTICLYI